MSTVRTCTTPEEGWTLCSHFLGNLFLRLTTLETEILDPSDLISIKRREKITSDTRAQLVGNLHMIMRRMENYYHYSDAIKMSLILDMVVELDIVDPGARASILREFEVARRTPKWMSYRG